MLCLCVLYLLIKKIIIIKKIFNLKNVLSRNFYFSNHFSFTIYKNIHLAVVIFKYKIMKIKNSNLISYIKKKKKNTPVLHFSQNNSPVTLWKYCNHKNLELF